MDKLLFLKIEGIGSMPHLVYCICCKGMISNETEISPHCGQPNPHHEPTEDDYREMRTLARQGHKLEAIKKTEIVDRVSLKEANDMVNFGFDWLVPGVLPNESEKPMKKVMKVMENDPDLLEEYDFRGGIRGKYTARYKEGTNIVMLDPDVAEMFHNSESVNQIFRALIPIIRQQGQQA